MAPLLLSSSAGFDIIEGQEEGQGRESLHNQQGTASQHSPNSHCSSATASSPGCQNKGHLERDGVKEETMLKMQQFFFFNLFKVIQLILVHQVKSPACKYLNQNGDEESRNSLGIYLKEIQLSLDVDIILNYVRQPTLILTYSTYKEAGISCWG